MTDLVIKGQSMADLYQRRQDELASVNHSVAISSAKAVREVEASLMIAKARPRDELQAYGGVVKCCQRPAFAEKAIYRFSRGGQAVEGPSIRLAEALAMNWGNLDYGWRELERTNGKSLVEAYAWDLQTNVKRKLEFEVAHIRDTKKGPVMLTQERDIYEMLANYAARRVRACILAMIPADIIEDAIEAVNKTLTSSVSTGNRDDTIKKMVIAFEQIGVTQDMLKRYIKAPVMAASNSQIVELKKVYVSIKDGIINVGDAFPENASETIVNTVTEISFDKKRAAMIELITSKLNEGIQIDQATIERIDTAKNITDLIKIEEILQEMNIL